MRFGKSAEEAEKETPRNSGGGWMKYPKAGETVVRILDEPDKWIYYWEHFNPNGFSFPCNSDDRANCHGCQSDDPKMQKASRKVAMNCFDGEYTNVWKFPKKSVADRLKSRWERNGTITDRDYLIRQVKDANSTDYDVEGLDKEPMDLSQFAEFLTDPEVLLEEAYEEAWGDSKVTTAARKDTAAPAKKTAAAPAKKAASSRPKIEPAPKAADNPAWEPPAEEPEKVITEAELRQMDVFDLQKLCQTEGFGDIPAGVDAPDDIVDWMMAQS